MLQTAFFEMDQDKLRAGLRQHDCELVQFEMNVPHASHMGGSWERMIKSVRAALDGVLETRGRQTCLDDELLRTFLTEAEAIVNSRPITYFSMDASETHDPQPLSPMLLLTQKSSVVLPPPGAFRREDLYCRQRWRAVQFMADDFWRRWRVEFLPAMQRRQKWTTAKQNPEVGDVVLVTDDELPRSQWPLGRVTEIHQSRDGLVRKVSVRVRGGIYARPVHKLIPLLSEREE